MEGPTIAQINFKFSMSTEEFNALGAERAEKIAGVPGLRWKIWLIDEVSHTGGGIYLFDDEAAAEAYLQGPLVAALQQNPRIGEMSAKLFGINEAATDITRGPLYATAP